MAQKDKIQRKDLATFTLHLQKPCGQCLNPPLTVSSHRLFPSKSAKSLQLLQPLFATLLVCSLLLSSSVLEPAMAQPRSPFCDGKCKTRCNKAAVWDRCFRYCGLCCEECKCVPSGTYGNKHECPCYRDKVNKKGKPKCP